MRARKTSRADLNAFEPDETWGQRALERRVTVRPTVDEARGGGLGDGEQLPEDIAQGETRDRDPEQDAGIQGALLQSDEDGKKDEHGTEMLCDRTA